MLGKTHPSKKITAALLAVAILLLASAQAQAQVRLLTSIKPLQLIAAAVQDGADKPEALLPPGASPHDFALRLSDLRRLSRADLFYWIGPDLEVFLQRALGNRRQTTVAVQKLPGIRLRRFGEAGHGHADDDHDAEHQPGSLDSHLWLDSANARVIAQRMAQDLSAADPTGRGRYQANLASFRQRLDALDERLRQRLAPLAGKPYFVFHDAYSYFEDAYGLTPAGVFVVQSEVPPGARHLAAMRARLQQAGASCLFNEPPIRPPLASSLSQGLPVRLAELDDLGFAIPVDARGYEGLLNNLAEEMARCLERL